MNTSVIVTHHKPHADERLAIWLVRNFGITRFPGADTAPVKYVDAGTIPEGASADEREKLGELWIGVGGGRFDEHPVSGKARAQNECAATLIATELGFRDKSEFKQLLDAVCANDTKGGGALLSVARVITQMNHLGDDDEVIQNWADAAFDAFYRTQTGFFDALNDLHNPKVTTIDTLKVQVAGSPEPKEFRLVTTRSPKTQMSAFARSSFGCKASLVIQRSSETGQTYISGYSQSGIRMELLAAAIRRVELALQGKKVSDQRELFADGTIPEVPEWNFHKEAGWIMNGSLTAPNKIRSVIPLEKLRGLAHDAIRGSFRKN